MKLSLDSCETNIEQKTETCKWNIEFQAHET